MRGQRQLHVIMLRAAALLLVLVMLSTSMVAGRYARYTTSASGSDSARVAKFSVTESGAFGTAVKVDLRPGETVPLAVHVKNDSEVAVSYRVEAENEFQNLPLEFTLLDEGSPVDAATLAPGKAKELTYRIGWQAGDVDDEYIGMVDLVHLTIHVTQID